MRNTLQSDARKLSSERSQRLQALIAQLPKIELHRHLPGSIRTQTFFDLAAEYGNEIRLWLEELKELEEHEGLNTGTA